VQIWVGFGPGFKEKKMRGFLEAWVAVGILVGAHQKKPKRKEGEVSERKKNKKESDPLPSPGKTAKTP